jgi:cyclopropane-fatty-acyl-phospholipid synthase
MNLDQAITLPRRQSGRSLFRNAVEARLALLEHGLLEIERGGHTSVFGAEREGELGARITIHDERFYQRLALGGTLGAAESYLEGEWDSRDLTGLVRLTLRNASALGALESGTARYGAALARLWGALRRNTRAGSRKNIESHYDLGNDFFERMLDPT